MVVYVIVCEGEERCQFCQIGRCLFQHELVLLLNEVADCLLLLHPLDVSFIRSISIYLYLLSVSWVLLLIILYSILFLFNFFFFHHGLLQLLKRRRHLSNLRYSTLYQSQEIVQPQLGIDYLLYLTFRCLRYRSCYIFGLSLIHI